MRNCSPSIKLFQMHREPFKNYLADFARKGGVPPLSAKLFLTQRLSVKGGGVSPNSVKEKIRLKTAFF